MSYGVCATYRRPAATHVFPLTGFIGGVIGSQRSQLIAVISASRTRTQSPPAAAGGNATTEPALPEGKYKVRIANPAFPDYVTEIHVSNNNPATLAHDFNGDKSQ